MNAKTGRQLLYGLAVVGLLVGCGSPAAAPSKTPSASAAEPTATPTLSADSIAVRRATGVLEALGLDVPTDATIQVRASDPVTDGTGTVVSLDDREIAWDARGVLSSVFVPSSPGAVSRMGATEAGNRITQVVAALGVKLPAPDSLAYEDNVPDWTAQWSRAIDGIPAPGDGTKIMLTPDGLFLSYWHLESAAAPKPAHPLTEAQAKAKFTSCKNSSKGAGGKPETCTVKLVWYRPMSVSPDQPLRLFWQVQHSWWDKNQGGSAGTNGYVDAATGEVLDFGATM
jgi:hypothetical protein